MATRGRPFRVRSRCASYGALASLQRGALYWKMRMCAYYGHDLAMLTSSYTVLAARRPAVLICTYHEHPSYRGRSSCLQYEYYLLRLRPSQMQASKHSSRLQPTGMSSICPRSQPGSQTPMIQSLAIRLHTRRRSNFSAMVPRSRMRDVPGGRSPTS